VKTKNIYKALLTVLFLLSQSLFAHGEGKIKLSLTEKDSIRQVKATITQVGEDGTVAAVKGVDVKIYVKRTFSLLPVEGENLTTDENGEATVDFPKDIPGDSSGTLTIVAKVEDNEELGELEASQVIKWGTLLQPDLSFTKRALWRSAANAPLPLVIFVTSMVALVWGVIFYILFLLIRINKIGKLETK
jgi:hypothetical protein